MALLRVGGATGGHHLATNPQGELIIGVSGATTGNIAIGVPEIRTDVQQHTNAAFVTTGTGLEADEIFIIDSTLPSEVNNNNITQVNIHYATGEESTFVAGPPASSIGGNLFLGVTGITVDNNPVGTTAERGLLLTYINAATKNQAVGSIDLGNFTVTVSYDMTGSPTFSLPIADIRTGMQFPLLEGEDATIPNNVVLMIDTKPHTEIDK